MRRFGAAVSAFLLACTHAPRPGPLESPVGPRGFVEIESRPSAARVVVDRAGDRRLACPSTPCRFELSPGPAQLELLRFGYAWSLSTVVVPNGEDRYVVQLEGGLPSPGPVAFWGGVLGLFIFGMGTAGMIGAHAGLPMIATFGGLTASTGFLVIVPLIWSSQEGLLLSHERRALPGGKDPVFSP
jgi:hypothetical protein